MLPLTKRQAQLVMLRCEKGLTGEEIAASLGILESSVRTHFWWALRRTGTRSCYQLCYRRGRLSMLKDITEGRVSLANEMNQ